MKYGKKKLIFLILFIFLFYNISAFSINSYGSNHSVLSPNKQIEGFVFYKEVTIIIPPLGGGGLTIAPSIKRLNYTICNYTYYHLLEYGDDTTKIEYLRDNLRKNNISADFTTLRDDYIPFTGKCSEIINRTLEEEFVCTKILELFDNLNRTITYSDINNLRKDIENRIKITVYLLRHYIENYNDLCVVYTEKPVKIDIQIEDKTYYWYLFFLIIPLIFLFDYYLNKKRIYLFLKDKFSRKKSFNLDELLGKK